MMAIPGFKTFLRPVLEEMAERKEISNPRLNLTDGIVKRMGFTQEDVNERLESGGMRLQNRIGWALTYLKKAGLISFPERGIAKITEQGIDFLKNHKGEIAPKDLEVFPSYLEFKKASLSEEEAVDYSKQIGDIDPEEKINLGYKEIKDSIVTELLEKLLKLNPTQFEYVVLDLVRAMGYGATIDRLEHTGGAGDFGIDGIVHLDRLGLDKIYLQAKRYQPEHRIPSSDIQKFFGALRGRLATKGIFITTSAFQTSALEYAKTVSDTLVLIDGKKLAELMIECEVGVSNKKKVVIPSIDNDYFEM